MFSTNKQQYRQHSHEDDEHDEHRESNPATSTTTKKNPLAQLLGRLKVSGNLHGNSTKKKMTRNATTMKSSAFDPIKPPSFILRHRDAESETETSFSLSTRSLNEEVDLLQQTLQQQSVESKPKHRVHFPTDPKLLATIRKIRYKTPRETERYWYSDQEVAECEDDAMLDLDRYLREKAQGKRHSERGSRAKPSYCIRGLECLADPEMTKLQLDEHARLTSAMRSEHARQVRSGTYPDQAALARVCAQCTRHAVRRAVNRAALDERQSYCFRPAMRKKKNANSSRGNQNSSQIGKNRHRSVVSQGSRGRHSLRTSSNHRRRSRRRVHGRDKIGDPVVNIP